jgi:hypothetical protein
MSTTKSNKCGIHSDGFSLPASLIFVYHVIVSDFTRFYAPFALPHQGKRLDEEHALRLNGVILQENSSIRRNYPAMLHAGLACIIMASETLLLLVWIL